MSPDKLAPLLPRLRTLYGDRADEALRLIDSRLAPVLNALPGAQNRPRWTERDVVLITYADILRTSGASPLATLREWLLRERLEERLNTVHLLPFYPYSSDDGFSVIDYLAVDPAAGDWDDVEALGRRFDLMFDLVLNHCSQHSRWFQSYLKGEPPYDKYFIAADPSEDLSQVVRPRSLPLLSPYETSSGLKHVWTTFSADQVDLNYAEPVVLAEMLHVLLEYVRRGARIVRLDAIAYLWKRIGTPCIHLSETHEVVKLARDLLEIVAPHVLVLTETNVPHRENVSYFGGAHGDAPGDEAHMVYNFSLPPLLLDAFASGDATAIRSWLAGLGAPPEGCAYFNFTASHDGVGVRPLEGLVSDARTAALVEHVLARGGRVSTRSRADGSDAPYELNISYVDALAPDGRPGVARDELHARRFLASQAVMLAMAGVPAVYFHSLVGTPNDQQGVEASGQNRRINRHKYSLEELEGALAAGGRQRRIYDGYRDLLAKRVAQPAFHPDAEQRVVDAGGDSVLAFQRTPPGGGPSVLVAVNFSASEQSFAPGDAAPGAREDLITGAPFVGDRIPLAPGQAVWLVGAK